MSFLKVPIQRLSHARDLKSLMYMTDFAAGMDISAALKESVNLDIDEIVVIPAGFKLAIPVGYEGQIRSRSGLAVKGVVVMNSPGTIDSDYRGEIKVVLANLGKKDFVIKRGDRIAQMVISPVIKVSLEEVTELPKTKRGSMGFGHTG